MSAGYANHSTEKRAVERITSSIRIAVVLSVAALLLLGTDAARRHPIVAWCLVAVAAAYAVAVFADPELELRSRASAATITSSDSVLASAIVASTGAAQSPAVAILFLVVVAAAMRLSFLSTVGVATVLGAVHLATSLFVDADYAPIGIRLEAGVWWAIYLVLTGALGAGLSLLTEYAERARSVAEAEANAERLVAEEERDLRTRLAASYEAQETGLRVILHEFRTPIASLRALVRQLVVENSQPASTPVAAAAVSLLVAHADHLSGMMDALADVAASHQPAFSVGTYRAVDLREWLLAACAAAGLGPGDCRMTVLPGGARCRLETQLVRRVVTNLLENARRYGGDEPVEFTAKVDSGQLLLEIGDRGPGISKEMASVLVGKFVAMGERQGTAGLGLWIVDQIVQSLGGQLEFRPRAGGGLLVMVAVPVQP
ncbi:HAMP domain-containing histidine kinase [Nocardia puris]|nr:HAMP domain-containing histidine kinase [Nocardia puris]